MQPKWFEKGLSIYMPHTVTLVDSRNNNKCLDFALLDLNLYITPLNWFAAVNQSQKGEVIMRVSNLQSIMTSGAQRAQILFF